MSNRFSPLRRVLLAAGAAAALSACQSIDSLPASPPADTQAVVPLPASDTAAARCEALVQRVSSGAPVDTLVLTLARAEQAGGTVKTREGEVTLPAHCLVEGYYGEHAGLIGGPYRTGFRMRLPLDWNGRFLFEGGGGSNGVVREALGMNGAGNVPALLRGYAVISQDSGHDNGRNQLATHGGNLVFGHDPDARRNYGHASLKPSYDLGRYLIRSFYGRDSDTNLFWGCSKGGQEGMAFAQRFPDAFDGIVAMAPGFSLPRAALAEAWDTQQFAGLVRAHGEQPNLASLKTVLSTAQFGLISQSVLAACDALDGAKDGMVAAVGACTNKLVLPELGKRQCGASGGNAAACLSGADIAAIERVMDGPHNSAGQPLYTSWAWDAGVGEPGWRVWKVGLTDGPPALNVVLGGGSLAAVFTTPPTALADDPQRLLAYQLAFDFDRDAPRIYAVAPPYKTSAWHDVGMRSSDLAAFRARGGKLIVPHGMADPVFSALDTIAWWNEVNQKNGGKASSFVRVFPVPGMNHCGGGPATDHFDSLTALEKWVTEKQAPDSIDAAAGAGSPWPDRHRPLCPYPQVALHANGEFRCGTLKRN